MQTRIKEGMLVACEMFSIVDDSILQTNNANAALGIVITQPRMEKGDLCCKVLLITLAARADQPILMTCAGLTPICRLNSQSFKQVRALVMLKEANLSNAQKIEELEKRINE